MSKFLKILSENAPDKTSLHQLLKDLTSVLTHLGYDVEETNNGIHIRVSNEEEDEQAATSDKVSQAVGILTTADKAFPPTTGPTTQPVSTQAKQIKSLKDSAMNALVGAVANATKTIQQSLTIK